MTASIPRPPLRPTRHAPRSASLPGKILCLLGLILGAAPAAMAQAPCAGKLLVSGYFSNNVHIYDACTGQFQRTLDSAGRISGAQALRIGPDGALYVVSEETSKVLRYRTDTLEYLDDFLTAAQGTRPTGLAFGPKGEAYVGGYASDDVRRHDADGSNPTRAVAANASGLNGPDNGLQFAADGKLYIPGYDSNSVVRFDPASGATNAVITSQFNGFRGGRGIFADADNQHLWITGELSGHLLKYNLASATAQVIASGLQRPTGLARGINNELLVISGDAVQRVNAASGALEGTLIPAGSGGLSGPTYVLLLRNDQARAPVDRRQVGSQYWITGATRLAGNVLDFTDAESATGTLFGEAFRSGDVQRRRWGRLRIEFTSCTSAQFTWSASDGGSAGFGSGGYPLSRVVSNEATTRCEQQGFGGADKSWVVGLWWGGETRSGEGIMIDYRQSDGVAFAAWFTHRPLP